MEQPQWRQDGCNGDFSPTPSGLDTFLRDAWTKEPVLIVSFTPGALAIILPPLSPYTKYAIIINQATPYSYPAPTQSPFEVMGTCLRCPAPPEPKFEEAKETVSFSVDSEEDPSVVPSNNVKTNPRRGREKKERNEL